jgi:nitrite reductase/ring-hydroxylating ferredoxin subunit
MIMGKWAKIAGTRRIPRNEMQIFKVKRHEILVANVEGEFYAFENQCPHMEYSLYLGSLEGEVLTCGFHYAQFSVTTGKSLSAATHRPLKTFKVKIQNSSILVEV